MLMFELSYCKLAFPIDHLAYKVLKNENLKINFP